MSTSNSKTTINCLRALSLDEIAEAQSGHPGIALGSATIFYTLFKYHLNICPNTPDFFNHDRFVVSAGHVSSLLYATMVCAGYKSISLNDLKKFRKFNSITAGHPEPSLIPGIEITSGPLGQGIAAAVGMAIAEKKLSKMFNVYGSLIDHYTYCFHGDGCLEEGIAYEAINIAGRLKLNKLILLYDSNKIQLDGQVADSTCMNVRKFFHSCGWNHIYVKNGNDVSSINNAIRIAKCSQKPTVIQINTIIGYGSPKAGMNTCHGSPFTKEEVKAMKEEWKYNYSPFVIPKSVETDFTNVIKKRSNSFLRKFYQELNILEAKDINLYNLFIDSINSKYNFNVKWFKDLQFKQNAATREIVGQLVDILTKNIPTLMVGSADVSSSTKIGSNKMLTFSDASYSGQRINYGVREFAMTGIVNGLTAHGGIKAIGSTFLTFMDYGKPAIRLAAVGHTPSINVYSHDSITVGEDGPTHQPIEQISSLRLIPNHYTFRPYNVTECIAALKFAINSNTSPVSIITSRGGFDKIEVTSNDIDKGAYIISDSNKNYELTIIATGSEVATAIKVQELLKAKNINSRVVSAPCLELFDKQDKKYINNILGKKPIVSIEFGATSPWYKYVDLPIGIDQFGCSAKAQEVVKKFELAPANIVTKIKNSLLKKKRGVRG